jgi:hypothetical protein
MRNIWVVMLFVVACGQPEPKAPQPKSASQEAASRAIERYQKAATLLVDELGTVINKAEGLKFFDHEQGRAAWRAFATELEAVDRDLELVAADPAFAMELCLACIEYDWNRNGHIDARDRKMLELEFDGSGGELAAGDPRRRPTYRFDRGDALWARAMIAFQRAAVELVLAYRWSELDKLFLFRGNDAPHMSIKLIDPGRVTHARELVLIGLLYADQTREAYLAETDDDREWVPNPRQKNYAMPLTVDAELYATWAAITGDLRRMLESKEGVSVREVATVFMGPRDAAELPNAFVDLGRMLRDPSDIRIELDESAPHPQMYEQLVRGLLGHGYAETMRASPLVGRLRHMKEEVERGQDTIGRKLRYLLWLN